MIEEGTSITHPKISLSLTYILHSKILSLSLYTVTILTVQCSLIACSNLYSHESDECTSPEKGEGGTISGERSNSSRYSHEVDQADVVNSDVRDWIPSWLLPCTTRILTSIAMESRGKNPVIYTKRNLDVSP